MAHRRRTASSRPNCNAGSPTACRPSTGLLLLQASPLLQRATTAELVRLAGARAGRAAATGATLFKPGDGAAIYAVLTGQVT